MKDLPRGVICTERKGDYGNFLFVMNFTPEEVRVTPPESVSDLLTGEQCHAEFCLPPYGYKILTDNTKNAR